MDEHNTIFFEVSLLTLILNSTIMIYLLLKMSNMITILPLSLSASLWLFRTRGNKKLVVTGWISLTSSIILEIIFGLTTKFDMKVGSLIFDEDTCLAGQRICYPLIAALLFLGMFILYVGNIFASLRFFPSKERPLLGDSMIITVNNC